MTAAILAFYQGFTQDFYQGEVWQLLTNTGPVARLVLLMLLGFSILSWAIILRKLRVFRTARNESAEFLKVFRQSNKPGNSRLLPQFEGEPPYRRCFNPATAKLRARPRRRRIPASPEFAA